MRRGAVHSQHRSAVGISVVHDSGGCSPERFARADRLSVHTVASGTVSKRFGDGDGPHDRRLTTRNAERGTQNGRFMILQKDFISTEPGVRLFVQTVGAGPQVVLIPNGYYLFDALARF